MLFIISKIIIKIEYYSCKKLGYKNVFLIKDMQKLCYFYFIFFSPFSLFQVFLKKQNFSEKSLQKFEKKF